MPENNYSNPTSLFPNSSDYNMRDVAGNSLSLYPTMNASESKARSLPFIDMEEKSRGYDLQRKALETGEFGSPEATEARMSEHRLKGKKNAAEEAILPYKTEAEKRKYQEETLSAHDVGEAERAKSQEIVRNLRQGPHRELMHRLGNLHDRLMDEPTKEGRAQMYFSTLKDFQQEYPNIQIPGDMHTLSNAGPNEPEPFENGSSVMKHLAALRSAQMDAPELANKRLEILLQNQGRAQNVATEQAGATTRTGMTNQTGRDVAREATERAAAVAGLKHPVAQASTEYKKDPSEENLMNLRSHLEREWNTDVATKRYGLATTLEQTAKTPKDRAEAASYLNQKKAEYFEGYGVYLDPRNGQLLEEGATQDVKGKTYKYKGQKFNPKKNDSWELVK